MGWVIGDNGRERERKCTGQRGNDVTGHPFTGFTVVTSKVGNSGLTMGKGGGNGLRSGWK